MRILAAVDFSDSTRILMNEIAGRPWPPGSEVRLLHVVEPPDLLPGSELHDLLVDQRTVQANNLLSSLVSALLIAGGVVTASSSVVEGHAKRRIPEEAESWNADLVVLGSQGHSALSRFLLGSISRDVLRRATCSVEVVRPRPSGNGEGYRVLLATDGSECSLRAARSVAARPWPDGTSVEILAVTELLIPSLQPFAIAAVNLTRLLEETRQAAVEGCESARKVLEAAGLATKVTMAVGEPRSLILQACGLGVDLAVVGSHGRHGFERFLLGSVSEAVAIHAPCSVEVVRVSS